MKFWVLIKACQCQWKFLIWIFYSIWNWTARNSKKFIGIETHSNKLQLIEFSSYKMGSFFSTKSAVVAWEFVSRFEGNIVTPFDHRKSRGEKLSNINGWWKFIKHETVKEENFVIRQYEENKNINSRVFQYWQHIRHALNWQTSTSTGFYFLGGGVKHKIFHSLELTSICNNLVSFVHEN